MTIKRQPSASRKSTETFGELVKRVRKEEKETQGEWIARFPMSRQTLSKIENDSVDGPRILAFSLIRAYPEREAEIKAAVELWAKQLPPAKRKRASDLETRVESFISTGRFDYAKTALLEGLKQASDGG